MALLAAYLGVVCLLLPLLISSLPIVDPGVFVLQGIVTCGGGKGYCMLGMDCTADIDFLPALPGQHCDGLADAFTPSVQFTCCRYNERGKASSEAPTTEQSSFTITDVEQFLQEEVPVMEYQQNNEVPEGVDVESLINIVGVITDMTGVLGLVTEPYKATIPSHTTAPPTTTTTTPAPTDFIKMDSNSSHASISLADILNSLRVTQAPPSTTTTGTPETKTTMANAVTKIEKKGTQTESNEDNKEQTIGTSPIIATSTVVESGKTETVFSQRPTLPQSLLNTVTSHQDFTTAAPTLTTASSSSLGLQLPSDQDNSLSVDKSRNTIVIER